MSRGARVILILVLVVSLAGIEAWRAGIFRRPEPGLEAARQDPQAALRLAGSLTGGVRAGQEAAERARALLEAVLRAHPRSEQAREARRQLVELEGALGDAERQEEAIWRALNAAPEEAEFAAAQLLELGGLAAGPLDKPEKAIEAYRSLLALYPESRRAPEGAIRLALLLEKKGEPGAAAEALLETHRRHPGAPLADDLLFLARRLLASAPEGQARAAEADRLLRREFPTSPYLAAGSAPTREN